MKPVIVLLALFAVAKVALAQSPMLNAAVLPNSRSVSVGATATFFSTISNSGTGNASHCTISLSGNAPAGMTISYQTTDSTNQLTGLKNEPANIDAGASQNFLINVSSNAPYTGKVPLSFTCLEGNAFSFVEVNQPDISFQETVGPDIIAIGVTLSNDGIAVLDRNANLAALSIAAVNIGTSSANQQNAGAPITVSGEVTGFMTAGQYDILICETDANGACIAPLNNTVATAIGREGRTFSAFLVGDPALGLPFFPSDYRIKILFRDSDGNVAGSTSAALNSDAPGGAGPEPVGYWEGNVRANNDFTGENISKAAILIPPDNLPILGFIVNRDPVTGELVPQVFKMYGQFDPETNTRTGTLAFLDHGNVAGGQYPATLTYIPGKQITIAYLAATAAEVPGHSDGGSMSTASSLPGNAGVITGTLGNLFAKKLEGEEVPINLQGTLDGSGADAIHLFSIDGTLKIDEVTGAVAANFPECPGTTVDVTALEAPNPNDLPLGSLNLVKTALTLKGCPSSYGGNINLDGYLFFKPIVANAPKGNLLTPFEQKFADLVGANFSSSGAIINIDTGANANTPSTMNAVMSNPEGSFFSSNRAFKVSLVDYGHISANDSYKDFVASNFDYIVSGDQILDFGKLRSINPDIVILSYYNSYLFDPGNPPPSSESANLHDQSLPANALDPDKRLGRIAFGQFWYAMDPSSSEWQAYSLGEIRRVLDNGFDGVLIDDVFAHLMHEAHFGVSEPMTIGQPNHYTEFTTVPAWYDAQKSHDGWASYISFLNSNIDKYIVFNGINDLAENSQPISASYHPSGYLNVGDGAVQEGFVYNGAWITNPKDGFFGDDYWEAIVNILTDAPPGKIHGVVSYGNANFWKARSYALASYLLGYNANGKSSFYYAPNEFTLTYLPEWGLDYGKPLQSYPLLQQYKDVTHNVFSREFENALIMINPYGTPTGNIKLADNYFLVSKAGDLQVKAIGNGASTAIGEKRQLTFKLVSSVQMEVYSAVILIKRKKGVVFP